MRISFCFILPGDDVLVEDEFIINLLCSRNVMCLAVFKDDVSLSRFSCKNSQILLTPADWKNVKLSSSLLATYQSLKGVENLFKLSKERFCIFIDDFESLLLQEELLYFILSHDLFVFARCRSTQTIHYFRDHFNLDERYQVIGQENSSINKKNCKCPDQMIRFYKWSRDTSTGRVLYISPMTLHSFYRLTKVSCLKAIYFHPSITITEKLIVKCLSLKNFDGEHLEIVGNFEKNQSDGILQTLKGLILKQFIQWQYGI